MSIKDKNLFKSKKLLIALRIIIVILILMIAFLWLNIYKTYTIEDVGKYYNNIQKYESPETKGLNGMEVKITGKSIDKMGNNWFSLDIERFNMSLDIPEYMLNSSIEVNDQSIKFKLDKEYTLYIINKNLSNKELENIQETLLFNKDNKDRANLHLESDIEKWINVHMDYAISEKDIILISDIMIDNEYGYKYSAIRDGTMTSVSFTKFIGDEKVDKINTDELSHLINTINIRIQ